VAITEIHSAFDKAAEINSFKLRVARWLRFGPQHPAVRARFRARTAALPQWRLDAAIGEVEHWWREERKTFRACQRARLRLAAAARNLTRAAANLAAAAAETHGGGIRGDDRGYMRG
jgi:hypothetical protein